MHSPNSQLARMAQTSQTASPGTDAPMRSTRQSPFIRSPVASGTRYGSSSGSSVRSRRSISPTSPMRATQNSMITSLMQSATAVSKETIARDYSKGEFNRFLDDRASQGIKKPKQSSLWKKFLNLKAGIIEPETNAKKLPPIRIDNKQKPLSQNQQMTLALYNKIKLEKKVASQSSI